MCGIKERIHELYWNKDINCAGTMLTCMGDLFQVEIKEQVFHAAVGMHGAGGFRAQCGLVEGGLMFIGIYFNALGKSADAAVVCCYRYAEAFKERFGSLGCSDLRPGGFQLDD